MLVSHWHRGKLVQRTLNAAAYGLVLALVCGAQPLMAQCPNGSIVCNGARVESPDATLDSECAGVKASFDAAEGTMSAVAGPGSSAIVRNIDRFELHGVPGVPAVSIRIRLSLSGFLAEADIHYGALMFLGFRYEQGEVRTSETVVFDSHFSAFVIDHEVDLEALVIPGQPFHVAYNVQLNGIDRGGNIAGVLSFVDLPPGASVMSCKGFQQTAVQLEATTWSRVKALF